MEHHDVPTNTLQHPARGMSSAIKDWKRIEKENQKKYDLTRVPAPFATVVKQVVYRY